VSASNVIRRQTFLPEVLAHKVLTRLPVPRIALSMQDAQHGSTVGAQAVPSCETTYDLCPSESPPFQPDHISPVPDPQSSADPSALAMYKIWYSLVDTLQLEGEEHGFTNADAAVSQQHLPIFQELASGQVRTPLDCA
jgi:hypothetical protein